MNVIIVCHTEFGTVEDKRVVFTKNPIGVAEGVPNLLKVTDKYGAKVTFAVCPEVANYFPWDGKSEIGLHLHPGWEEFKRDGKSWYVGDEWLRNIFIEDGDSTALRDYDPAIIEDMIGLGAYHIKKSLAVQPTTFVSGRWSMNNSIIDEITWAGFTHDCSCFTTHKQAHFDWSKVSRFASPYQPSKEDYQKSGDVPLLIIPISQLLKGGNVNPESAVTYPMPWFKLAFEEYYRRNCPVFHICLHSPIMTDQYFVDFFGRYLEYIAGHKNINFKYAREIEG